MRSGTDWIKTSSFCADLSRPRLGRSGVWEERVRYQLPMDRGVGEARELIEKARGEAGLRIESGGIACRQPSRPCEQNEEKPGGAYRDGTGVYPGRGGPTAGGHHMHGCKMPDASPKPFVRLVKDVPHSSRGCARASLHDRHPLNQHVQGKFIGNSSAGTGYSAATTMPALVEVSDFRAL